jgi:glycosyltransferase involved in cell wall biosynthesis
MKDKILIIPSYYPNQNSPVGGIFVQEQAKILSTKYDVAVLIAETIAWREFLKKEQQTNYFIENIKHYDNFQVYRSFSLRPTSRILRVVYWAYLKAAKQGFIRLLHIWGNPKIIHAHVVLPGGWIATQLGKQYNIPVVLTEHSGPFSAHLTTKFQKQLVKKTLNRTHKVIAVSPFLKKQIQDFNQEIDCEIIGNVINTKFFSLTSNRAKNINRSKIVFLTIALLSEGKGIKYLLEATQYLIKNQYYLFEIIIGGDGLERNKLEKLAEKLGILDFCTFLGILSPCEVKHWMQQCDVFILPSLHETFGIVLGEAMSCGKPVISTYCGGAEFVVTSNTGILVEIRDTIALAKAMEKFINRQIDFNPEEIRNSISQRFGEETFLSNISKIYEKLL